MQLELEVIISVGLDEITLTGKTAVAEVRDGWLS